MSVTVCLGNINSFRDVQDTKRNGNKVAQWAPVPGQVSVSSSKVLSRKGTRSDLHFGKHTPVVVFQVKPVRNWTLKAFKNMFAKGLPSAQHNATFYIFEKSPCWASLAQRQSTDTLSAHNWSFPWGT